jgi:hypothetical protein
LDVKRTGDQAGEVVDRRAVGVVISAADDHKRHTLGEQLRHQATVAAELKHQDSGDGVLEE